MADDAIIQKRTMAEEVAAVLRARILSGRLVGGEPIRQEHVAKELGVSRIPLREALSQLAAEGFVTLVAHKGAVVAPLSASAPPAPNSQKPRFSDCTISPIAVASCTSATEMSFGATPARS